MKIEKRWFEALNTMEATKILWLIFFHYLGKIAGLRPAIFSGTPRNSENQILSIINSKKWPESPQKHQKIQKSIMLK